MAGRAKDGAGPQAEDVAAYVATMALELKSLVEPHNLRSLAYLLDLVRMERRNVRAESRIASPGRK